MKRFILLFLVAHAALTAGIPVQEEYYGPTEQLIKRDSWKVIQNELNKIEIPKSLLPFFSSISKEEDWGHIGYHGATQDYRIYQDIIRFTVEEILCIPLRDDFHFLRIPGDTDLNLNTIEEFSRYWGKEVDNKSKVRQKQLLALNYGIYSNYNRKGSCSIHLFANDYSKTDIDYYKHLIPFYQDLGIPADALKTLFNMAHKRLKSNYGILLRLSENSHLSDSDNEAYNFADEQCYPSKKGGYRYGSRLISEEFACIMSDYYVEKEDNIAPQLRLLINNKNTLNPYSNLSVERYDLYDSKTLKIYEKEMREYIQDLKRDPKKVNSYREKLMRKWIF